jgi:hypothetical protein
MRKRLVDVFDLQVYLAVRWMVDTVIVLDLGLPSWHALFRWGLFDLNWWSALGWHRQELPSLKTSFAVWNEE